MKLLTYILAVLFLAVVAGLLAQQDTGYVLIGRGFTTMEMSLSLFITLQIILFTLLYLAIRVIRRSWTLPDRLRLWRKQSRMKKAHASSRKGLVALAQGHWKQAERALIRHADDSDVPLLNYLSAARAAQEQDAPERRDHYLSMAHKSMPDADIAVELTQAELQISHGQLEHALATLIHLRSIAPRHTYVLLLLARVYEKLSSWGDLESLLFDLKKHKVVDNKEYERLCIRVYHSLLDIAANSNKAEKIIEVWNRIPSAFRERHELIFDYARNLVKLEEFDRAEILVRENLKRQWDNRLINLYGKIKSSSLDKQISNAESWLKGKENNPDLLLTLGRLCQYDKLWGKARNYLESSLGHAPRSETYCELGQLLEILKENDAAADCFKKGLLQAMREND